MAKKTFDISGTLNKNKSPQLPDKVPLKKTSKDTEVKKAQVEQIHQPTVEPPVDTTANSSKAPPASKNRSRSKPVAPEKEKLVRLTIDTPERMHKRLKIRAIEKGISMRDYILQLLEKELKK